MSIFTGDTNASIPFYVTRPTRDGDTVEYNMPLKQSLVALLLVYYNVVVWGVIGLVLALVVAINGVIDLVNLVF